MNNHSRNAIDRYMGLRYRYVTASRIPRLLWDEFKARGWRPKPVDGPLKWVMWYHGTDADKAVHWAAFQTSVKLDKVEL
jgi:hypothetical protein